MKVNWKMKSSRDVEGTVIYWTNKKYPGIRILRGYKHFNVINTVPAPGKFCGSIIAQLVPTFDEAVDIAEGKDET